MRFDELKASLKKGIMPIYLLQGEDAYLRSLSSKIIKKAVLTEPDLNYSVFEGEKIKADPSGFLSALRCVPFLSEKRVIEVLEWYPLASELKGEIKNYFESPYDTNVLIISDASKCKLESFKSVAIVDCSKPDNELIGSFIRSKCNPAGLICSSQVCRKIAEYCQYDMARIDNETQKLVAYSLGQAEITEESVELIVSKETDYQIYEMVGFIADKKYSKAYSILNEMIDLGDKQILLVSLYNHFRRLLYASLSKSTPKEVADALGCKEYAIIKAKQQALAFGAKKLKKVVEFLSEADASFKSGKISLDNALLNSVFNIMIAE